MTEFAPKRGEVPLGGNQFIAPPHKRAELPAPGFSASDVAALLHAHGLADRRRPSLFNAGVLAAFITAAGTIVAAYFKAPSASDNCNGADTHFSVGSKLTNKRARLQAMRDHMAKFGRCPFADMANRVMSEIEQDLYGQPRPPKPPAALPPFNGGMQGPARKPAEPQPVAAPQPSGNNWYAAAPASRGMVFEIDGIERPLKLATGYTTYLVALDRSVTVRFLSRQGERMYTYDPGDEFGLFTEGYSIFNVHTDEYIAYLKVTRTVQGNHTKQ